MSQKNQFYYDGASNLTCVRDPDNGLTYYQYDLLDRVISVKNPAGEVAYMTTTRADRSRPARWATTRWCITPTTPRGG